MDRRCYARSCRNTVRRGHAFCSACWRMVPRRQRNRVWRAWEAVEAKIGGGSQCPWRDIRRDWIRAIREARDALAAPEVQHG